MGTLLPLSQIPVSSAEAQVTGTRWGGVLLRCDPRKTVLTEEKTNRFVFKAGSLVFKMLTTREALILLIPCFAPLELEATLVCHTAVGRGRLGGRDCAGVPGSFKTAKERAPHCTCARDS